jgi:hypothetical protein
MINIIVVKTKLAGSYTPNIFAITANPSDHNENISNIKVATIQTIEYSSLNFPLITNFEI